jgi:phosphoribosylanthranilate isomerase
MSSTDQNEIVSSTPKSKFDFIHPTPGSNPDAPYANEIYQKLVHPLRLYEPTVTAENSSESARKLVADLTVESAKLHHSVSQKEQKGLSANCDLAAIRALIKSTRTHLKDLKSLYEESDGNAYTDTETVEKGLSIDLSTSKAWREAYKD